MMKKNKIRIISYCLLGSMLLSGCGSKGYEAPELEEPVVANEAYRPVEYGTIGDVAEVNGVQAIYNGVVAPTEYGHFFTGTTEVAEVKVNIGDYVEAGDVLAVADVEGASETIKDLNATISLNTRTWEIKEKIYEQSRLELEYKRLSYEKLGDTENANAMATQIAILDENHSYDKLLNKYTMDNLNKSLSEANDLAFQGNLVARSSGYVTFIKDFSDSDIATSGENIVVISDYEDRYIKLDATTNERITEIFHCYDALIDGKRYELVPYDYEPIEIAMAQAKGLYPKVRMKLADGTPLPEVGTDFIVMCYLEQAENVLVIGKDSIYEDTKGNFVYVKTDEGKEIRYVELGMMDSNNAEVISGLSEGEWVYYTSSAVIPDTQETYEVEIKDYIVYSSTDFYTVADSNRKKTFSTYEGQITNIYVNQGDEVEKGTPICTIKTNEGSALLTELSNSISNYKVSFSEGTKAYEELLAAKEQEIKDAYILSQNPPSEDTATSMDAATATDATLDTTPQYIPYTYEQLCCQLEVMKLNRQIDVLNYDYNLAIMVENYNDVSCNNDGNGTVTIYADATGKLSNLNIKEGKNIYVGDRLFNIETPSKPMIELRVEDGADNKLYLSQEVKFVHSSTDKAYSGTVIGTTGNMEDFYFSYVKDKVYMTSNNTKGNERFYVEMDDSFFEAPDDYVAGYPVIYMKDVIVIPKDALYYEEQVEKLYYYVWKIVDGEYVKQYVQILPTDGKTVSEICVLSGLKAGDIIVREKGEE